MMMGKLAILAALAGIASPGLARTYTLTELTVTGTAGFSSIVPKAINASGAVIGNGSSGYLQSTALMWTPAGVGRTLVPVESVYSRANSINKFGKVVGTAEFVVRGNRVSQAYIYDSISDTYVFPVGAGSKGNGINDAGQIVGEVNGQPFYFDPVAGVRTYELPNGIVSATFNGIGNDGKIVGIRSAVSPLGPVNSSASFVLSDANGSVPGGAMNPTFATTYLSGNNAGQFSIQQTIVNAPFFGTSSAIYNYDFSLAANQLGRLAGDEATYGGGFNDFLDIVGESYSENRYGGSFGDGVITTRDGVTMALAPLVGNLGSYFIQQGIAINNNGVIAGFGGGKAFVLRPDDLITPGGLGVPEPASWAMLIAGFGLTGAAMRRRRVVAA